MRSQEDIYRFLRKDMSPAEEAGFRREMEDDPFLADAVEGLSALHPEEASGILSDLRENLRETTAARAGQSWRLYAVAASLTLLAVCGYFLKVQLGSAGKAREAAVSFPENKGRADREELALSPVTEETEAPLTEKDAEPAAEAKVREPAINPGSAENTFEVIRNDKAVSLPPEAKTYAWSAPVKESQPVATDTVVQYLSLHDQAASETPAPTVTKNVLSGNSAGYAISTGEKGVLDKMLAFAEANYSPPQNEEKLAVRSMQKTDVYRKKEKALKDCETCPDTKNGEDAEAAVSRNYGMSRFREKDYPQAVKYLELVLKDQPSDQEARLYLCLAYLQTGQHKEASEEIGRMDSSIPEDMKQWLQAASHTAAGEKADAEKVLEKLSEGSGNFAAEAARMLEKSKK